jgi:fibronectin-binding autotransporter adhesin
VVCPADPIYGTWDGTANTCTITTSETISTGLTLQIDSGVTLATPSGSSLHVSGTVVNYGMIADSIIGIDSSGSLTNYGDITITTSCSQGGLKIGGDQGNLGGTLANYGTIGISGCLNLNTEGLLVNENTGSITMASGGNIGTSPGSSPSTATFDNYGTVMIGAGGNIAYGGSNLSPTITINNYGSIFIDGYMNIAYAYFSSSQGTFNNEIGGTVTTASDGNFAVQDLGQFVNYGTINNNGGLEDVALLNNYGNINNQGNIGVNTGDGISGVLNNEIGGTITNSGSFDVEGTLNNYGAVQSSGDMGAGNGGSIINYGAVNGPGNLGVGNGDCTTCSGSPLAVLDNYGTIDTSGSLSLSSGGAVTNENNGVITVENGGSMGGGSLISALTFTNYGMITIDIGGSFGLGGPVAAVGNIINYGAILDAGSMFTGPGAILSNENGATITFENTGNSFNGAVDNYGTITVENGGSASVSLSSNLDNKGTITIDSGGEFDGPGNNYALITVNGAFGVGTSGFNNVAGATITIGSSGLLNVHLGQFNNYGTTNNNGNILSRGVLNNYASISNQGSINVIPWVDGTGGILDNYGTIANPGLTDNYGTVNNEAGAMIDNSGAILNECGAIFTNSGSLQGNAVVNNCILPTTTTVTCLPGDLLVGGQSTCTATVTSEGGTLTGSVSFTGSGGTFSSAAGSAFTGPGTCSLNAISTGTSSCSVTFTSTGAGSQAITSSYSGDAFDLSSSGGTTVDAYAFGVATCIADGNLNCNDQMQAVFTSCTSTDCQLTATNPGEEFYVLQLTNNQGAISGAVLNVVIPYDSAFGSCAFVTQGAQPLMANGGPVSYTAGPCTATGETVSIDLGTVAQGQTIAVSMHLDYNLKYKYSGQPCTLSSPTFCTSSTFNRGYDFSSTITFTGGPSSGLATGDAKVALVGKQTTAVGGFLTDGNGDPKGGLFVVICSGTVTSCTADSQASGTPVNPISCYNARGVLVNPCEETSDMNGWYFFSLGSSGTYTVSVFNSVGQQKSVSAVSVGNNQFVENDVKNLQPSDPTISGWVATSSGLPVSGVTVQLIGVNGKVLATTTTNGGGYYVFRFSQPGSYIVRVLAPTGYTCPSSSVGVTVRQFQIVTVNFRFAMSV